MMDAHRTAQSPLPVQLAQFDEPGTPLLPVLGAVMLVLVGAAIGWVLGGRLSTEPGTQSGPVERVASLGPLRLDVDGSWTPVPAKGELASLGGRDVAVFAPVAGLPGRAWALLAPAADATLVPATVRARLAQPLGPPQRTTLAGHPAWSYGTLPLRTGGRLELAVLPTVAGMLLIGCEAEKSWWSTVSGCSRSLHAVGGAAIVPPAAGLAFRERVAEVVPVLNRKRQWAGQSLVRARTPAAQRAAALRLAAAHRAAAAELAPLAPPRGAAAATVARLRETADAYRALAVAAARHDRARYRSARTRTNRAEARLRSALRTFTA